MRITQKELREISNYNSETGELTWAKPRPKIRVGNKIGYLHHKGHWEAEINGKAYRLHQLVWIYVHGDSLPPIIDHIDRIKSNNRIENLRAATNGQNRANSKTTSATGFKGVTYNAKWGKIKPFRAAITANSKRILLGYFPTAEEAHAAYCVAAKEAFGDFFNVS